MKGFLSCLAALGWIGAVIYQMRRQLPSRCDIHGPEADWFCAFGPAVVKTQAHIIELREAADRRRTARRTGRSQTDEDLARDEDLRRKADINGAH